MLQMMPLSNQEASFVPKLEESFTISVLKLKLLNGTFVLFDTKDVCKGSIAIFGEIAVFFIRLGIFNHFSISVITEGTNDCGVVSKKAKKLLVADQFGKLILLNSIFCFA